MVFGRWALAVGLTAGTAFGVGGCDSLLGCTDAGCGSQLVVTLEGVDLDDYTYTMTMQVEGEAPVILDCFSETCSLDHPEWRDRYPDDVLLTLELADTTITRSFEPRYRSYHPNGRSCEPECRSAELTFSVD